MEKVLDEGRMTNLSGRSSLCWTKLVLDNEESGSCQDYKGMKDLLDTSVLVEPFGKALQRIAGTTVSIVKKQRESHVRMIAGTGCSSCKTDGMC